MNENILTGNVFSKQDLSNLLESLQKLVLYNATQNSNTIPDDVDPKSSSLKVSKSMQDLRMIKKPLESNSTATVGKAIPSASTATTGTSSTSEFWSNTMDSGSDPLNRTRENRDHHRFSRRNDPEFNMIEAEQRQRKIMQYKQQLEDQIVEKQSKQNLFRQNERIEDAIFERKLQQQRTMMKEEYEKEHSIMQTVQNNRKKDNRRNRSLSVYSLLHLVDDQEDEDSKNRNGNTKHRNAKSDNEGNDHDDQDDDDDDRPLRIALDSQQPPHNHTENNAILGVDVSTQTDLSLLLSLFDQICVEQQKQPQQHYRHHQSRMDRFSASSRMQQQQPQFSSNRNRSTSRLHNNNQTTTIKKQQR